MCHPTSSALTWSVARPGAHLPVSRKRYTPVGLRIIPGAGCSGARTVGQVHRRSVRRLRGCDPARGRFFGGGRRGTCGDDVDRSSSSSSGSRGSAGQTVGGTRRRGRVAAVLGGGAGAPSHVRHRDVDHPGPSVRTSGGVHALGGPLPLRGFVYGVHVVWG